MIFPVILSEVLPRLLYKVNTIEFPLLEVNRAASNYRKGRTARLTI
jgi:hypothetical protein